MRRGSQPTSTYFCLTVSLTAMREVYVREGTLPISTCLNRCRRSCAQHPPYLAVLLRFGESVPAREHYNFVSQLFQSTCDVSRQYFRSSLHIGWIEIAE